MDDMTDSPETNFSIDLADIPVYVPPEQNWQKTSQGTQAVYGKSLGQMIQDDLVGEQKLNVQAIKTAMEQLKGANASPWQTGNWSTYNVQYNDSTYPGKNLPHSNQFLIAEQHLSDLKTRLINALQAKGNSVYKQWIQDVVAKEFEITEKKIKGEI